MAATVLFASVVVGICLHFCFKRRRFAGHTPIRHPPGPRPHLFFGHTFQVPKAKAWSHFQKLGKEFGPMVRLSLADDDVVILNDPDDALELLGRRSYNYSSRKPLVYAGKYLSNNKRMVLMQYGPVFKQQRQAFHQMLQSRVIGSYERMQVEESAKLLYDMLTKPHEVNLNAKRFSASLVFRLTYGRHLSEDDADLKEVLEILDAFVEDCYPGSHLVDTFPILDSRFIPDWLASWRAEARRKHEREIKFYLRLLYEVKERAEGGEDLDCFAARLWDSVVRSELDDESLAYLAGSAFEAGTGTTSGVILFFVTAMVMFPDTLRRAQREIDSVLGDDSDAPPTFEHMDQLPYCVALCKEVFRWAPPAPGGFPHFSEKDDIYKGYTIRGGTMVIPNIWAMHYDERVFPNPHIFDPDRFLNAHGERKPGQDHITEGHWAFGFGRRACPGKYMGAKSVWIGITQMIWAFDISPELNEYGAPIPIDRSKVTNGINIEPEEFAVQITPRSLNRKATIEGLWADIQNSFEI